MAVFPIFRDFSGSRKRGFTSTPRAGAPVTPFWGFRSPGPGEPREGPFWALFGKIPKIGDFRGLDPGGVSRPPRGSPGAGSGDRRSRAGLQDPLGVPPTWWGRGRMSPGATARRARARAPRRGEVVVVAANGVGIIYYTPLAPARLSKAFPYKYTIAGTGGSPGHATLPQGGSPPAPSSGGVPPAPGRRWLATPAPGGYRGAPPRGVDVKPPRGRGPGEPPGAPKRPKMAKMAIFHEKPAFWPFLAKMAVFPIFRDFSGSRKRGFTSTPRAGAPVTPFWGFRSPGPGEPREGPFWALFGKIPKIGDFRGLDPGGVSRPPRGSPGAGSGDRRSRAGLQDPLGVPPTWWGRGRTSPGVSTRRVATRAARRACGNGWSRWSVVE